MTRLHKTCLLLLFLSLLLSAMSAVPIAKAESPDEFTQDDIFVYLPVVPHNALYPDPVVASYIQQTSQDNIWNTTADLVLDYSPRWHETYRIYTSCPDKDPQQYATNNLVRSLQYLEGVFRNLGYTLTTEPIANQNGAYNIVAHKPASAPYTASTIIDIGAHIDAWKDDNSVASTPGASDNAVSVAGIVEMARLLRDYPNQHPWQFVVFVGEEKGRKGSKPHADAMSRQPFKAALVFDGIGWSENDSGDPTPYMNCIWAFDSIPASVAIANLFDDVRQAYNIPIDWRRCSSTAITSDHVSYYEEQLPSVLSIGGIPYGGAYYHTCADDLATLNLENAYYTVQQNVGVLLSLDKEP